MSSLMDDPPEGLVIQEDGIAGEFWTDAPFSPRSVTDDAAGVIQLLASCAVPNRASGGRYHIRRLHDAMNEDQKNG